MIKFSQVSRLFVAFSVNATAGTRFNVAHGLGYTPALIAVTVIARSNDADTDNVTNFAVVKADSTNIVLKCDRTLNPAIGVVVIGLEEQGPFNSGRP